MISQIEKWKNPFPKILTEWWVCWIKQKFISHYKTWSIYSIISVCKVQQYGVLTEIRTKAWHLPADARYVSFMCVTPTPCRKH